MPLAASAPVSVHDALTAFLASDALLDDWRHLASTLAALPTTCSVVASAQRIALDACLVDLVERPALRQALVALTVA